VDIQLRDLQKRLAERKLTLELTPEAKTQLAERGYDPPLAVQVLAGQFTEGDHIVVEPNGETFTFRKEAPATVAS